MRRKRSGAGNAKILTSADRIWCEGRLPQLVEAERMKLVPVIGHSLCRRGNLYRKSLSQTLVLGVQQLHVKCHRRRQIWWTGGWLLRKLVGEWRRGLEKGTKKDWGRRGVSCRKKDNDRGAQYVETESVFIGVPTT